MKTPLRTFWQWKGGEPCLNRHDEPRCTMLEQASRWKRKNRVAQLKRTIARQAEEIEHLKNMLALHITAEHYRSTQTCIEWAAKHIRVETPPNNFEYDKATQQLTATIPAPHVFIDGLKYPTAQFMQNYAKP